MAKKILVVDDELRLVSVIRGYLEQAGYDVTTANNGKDALFAARQEKPDLIVLDLMMPEMDGYEFMRLHRKERETPIIMLTARVEEEDRIIGLELGADDYVTKPFSPRELVARVKAVLRRGAGNGEAHAEFLRIGEIEVDRTAHLARMHGNTLDLTPTEFDLLCTLMQSPGRAFSRMDLLERVQDEAFEAYERTIDQHIKNLRAKIEVDPRQPRYIETVYGVGYRFAME